MFKIKPIYVDKLDFPDLNEHLDIMISRSFGALIIEKYVATFIDN